nr:uncharacterized protein LOC117602517 [Osmia lignaria]
MSLRRSQRKKSFSKILNVGGNGKRKSRPSVTVIRTRSKTVQNVASARDLKEPIALSRRSSDSSVVYLGSYRKIPELIDLEDSCECYEEKLKTRSPKFEEVCETIHDK